MASKLHGPGDATEVDLTLVGDWLARYRKAKELEKVAKETAEEARSVLASHLEDAGAEYGTVDDVPVLRWHEIKSNRVDTTALRKAHPELVAEFTKASVSRRMDLL